MWYLESKLTHEIGRNCQKCHFPLCRNCKYFCTNVLEMSWGIQKCIHYGCGTSFSGRKGEFFHEFPSFFTLLDSCNLTKKRVNFDMKMINSIDFKDFSPFFQHLHHSRTRIRFVSRKWEEQQSAAKCAHLPTNSCVISLNPHFAPLSELKGRRWGESN